MTISYDDEYFTKRIGNDPKRLKQFILDGVFIRKFIQSGKVCDVGCSTGEFLRTIGWEGERYGMEVNDFAIEQAGDFINFEKNITNQIDFFDLIIFRGTIQHVNRPFEMLNEAYSALKPGGFLCFLATPNTSSPLYKAKRNLPFIEWDKVFFVPEEKTFLNALENVGFDTIKVEFPYLGTPYAVPILDHLRFLANLFSRDFLPHAFWRSSMSIMVQKPK